MVSSLLADALADPIAVLSDLFNDNDDLDAFPEIVAAHFSDVFSSSDAFTEIPALHDPANHKEGDIVRFRAMVQDTSPSPEIYLARRPGQRCGGWGQSDPLPLSLTTIDYADLRECTVLWAVSVPGESQWCTQAVDIFKSNDTPISSIPLKPHKFPVPAMPHVGAQIKIYNHTQSPDVFNSSELVTFVGIFSLEPLNAHIELDSTSSVPTLHILFSQPVPLTVIPRLYPAASYSIQTRDELIAWIADTSLAGDREASEWVLLSIISRVHSRNPPILPLSLSLSRFPSPKDLRTTPTLSHLLSQIIVLLTTLPLSLENLNHTSFAPQSKDEDLHSGYLQLPRGSVCVVTESGVTEGKVAEQGIMNLRAVQDIMSTQRLEYVFPFSTFTFDTDLAFLVLTEGEKSLFFQTDFNIPLKPKETSFDFYATSEDVAALPRDKLEAFRSIIGAAKTGNVSVGEETAQFIQDDFVKERQAASSTSPPSANELIQRMLVARLLALSRQEKEITLPIWKAAKDLEGRRKARLTNAN